MVVHEKSTRQILIDNILDHPANAHRDPHEYHALAKSLNEKRVETLEQIWEILQYDPDTPTPIQ